ncbi:hypothetical protein [Candidatus Nitrospira bockiana]
MQQLKTWLQVGLVGLALLASAAPGDAAGSGRGERAADPAQLALRYAEAFAAGQTTEWARRDLGCLHRKAVTDAAAAQRCWQDTLAAHRALVADDPEPGVFGAMGRGVGFGVLAERHRSSVLWREYPPGVFVSPAVVRQDAGSVPVVKIAKAWPTKRIALVLSKGAEPASVRGTAVDITVAYPDPMTAPLALKPDEVWWTNGALRRYGPVREVTARFVVVSGLRAHGYPRDAAVVNEALSDAPSLPGVEYGVPPEGHRVTEHAAGRASDGIIRGMLVPGSPRWWDRASADAAFQAGLQGLSRATSPRDRVAILTRLLLIDARDQAVNARLGRELYDEFLSEGLKRSGINAAEASSRDRLAELYWNLQAQTWRQELTAVAAGDEPAADALYGAIAALETAGVGPSAAPEIRRRLGTVYRWNNEGEAALRVHEALLKDLPDTEVAERGRVLAEIAWDRIQWVSWNRRYDHPWLGQAKDEAQQALAMVGAPEEKLLATESVLLVEALAVPRNLVALQASAALARQWHDQIAGVDKMWDHLIGNDVVKAVVPEAETITLLRSARSPDVLEVGIHARPPAQDILRHWEFDRDAVGHVPSTFSAVAVGESATAAWRVEQDPEAPSPPHVLAPSVACGSPQCWQLFLADVTPFEYPDVTAHVQVVSGGDSAGAGLALAGRDGQGLYAVIFLPASNTIVIQRIENGRAVLVGSAPVRPTKSGWHRLRVQRSNFVNVSLPRLEIYFDGTEVHAVTQDAIGEISRVGPVVQGDAVAKFDTVRVLDMVSNRPLSKPAAY